MFFVFLGSLLNESPFVGTHDKEAPFLKGITEREPDLENYPYHNLMM